MVTKSAIKLIHSLKDKKNRQEHGLFVVEGSKTIHELLASKIVVKTLFATQQWFTLHTKLLKSNIECVVVNDNELKQLSNLVSPQDAIALAQIPQNNFSEINLQQTFSIVLDGIQDPGNMGTIIRIADWYGIENIFCSTHCADIYNPKVIQSSMGSFLRTKVFYTNIAELFEANKNVKIYGAVMNGKSVYETHFDNGFLLVGNEGAGISDELMKFVTEPISIPKRGEAESLNAGVATAIICDAWARNN